MGMYIFRNLTNHTFIFFLQSSSRRLEQDCHLVHQRAQRRKVTKILFTLVNSGAGCVQKREGSRLFTLSMEPAQSQEL